MAGLEGRYLLHVGAMVPRKDLPTLLEAFASLAARESDLYLVLAGNKTRRWASSWEEMNSWLLARPALRRRVVVLDYFRDRELPALYRHAAAAVSCTLWEGFGLTVLEGLASGVPVVSSRISSIPEIAGDAVYYGSIREPETYACAIQRALEGHDAEQAAIGRQVARSFSWRSTAERTRAAYAEAAGVPLSP